VRLLLYLKAAKDQIYENNYNRSIQAFVYDLMRDTKYDYLHNANKLTTKNVSSSADEMHLTPFCFSNIFPYGDMKDGHTKSLIISSPDSHFIYVLKQRIVNLNSRIHLGYSLFDILDYKTFNPNILDSQFVFTTSTPILLRIPQYIYQNYNLQLKHPYKYIYWRYDYPLELFLNQIWINLKKKYKRFYGSSPNTNVLNFSKFVFKKQVSQKILIHGSAQIVIGTLWDFWFDDEENENRFNSDDIYQSDIVTQKKHDIFGSFEAKRLVHFALEAGLGERNTLGFGFLNLPRRTK
jgi:CRISPR-associated endoribonuclease Cas6